MKGSPYAVPPGRREYIDMAGAGHAGAHVIITASAPFEGGSDEYVYMIEVYTDETSFSVLQEGGDVTSNRLNAGGSGYPERAFIPGKFTRITPSGDAVVAGFVLKKV